MIKASVSAEIHAPIEKVYSYVLDLSNMIHYNSSVKLSDWKDRDAKICKIKISLSVIQFDSEYKILEEIPMSFFKAQCSHSTIEFIDSYEFSKTENGTLLKISDEMKLKGLLSFSEGLVRPILQNDMEANMKRLKGILDKI
ncbi:MAG: SRPBCC family protein [Leptospiraceae bacterium]|nr:SRPBCC family protein [Leptospiraceae bacterium]